VSRGCLTGERCCESNSAVDCQRSNTAIEDTAVARFAKQPPTLSIRNAYQLQAVMGHKDARSTAIYVQGAAGMIKGLWD
jgi:hypothetical protein